MNTFTKNIACTWGSLFEHLAREIFERKHSVSVFEYKSSVRPPIDSPLCGKLAFSSDGYFYDDIQNVLKLLEFKCLYTRRIARGIVPNHYLDQIQNSNRTSLQDQRQQIADKPSDTTTALKNNLR